MAKKKAGGAGSKATVRTKKGALPNASPPTLVSLAAIHRRVAALEKKIGVAHEVLDLVASVKAKGGSPITQTAKALQSINALSSSEAASAQVVDVIFDLDTKTTTAKYVRVYQSGSTEDIANSAAPHGVLARQIVGSTTTVVMEVQGKQTDIGAFLLQHTVAPSISLAVSKGPTGIKFLTVT